MPASLSPAGRCRWGRSSARAPPDRLRRVPIGPERVPGSVPAPSPVPRVTLSPGAHPPEHAGDDAQGRFRPRVRRPRLVEGATLLLPRPCTFQIIRSPGWGRDHKLPAPRSEVGRWPGVEAEGGDEKPRARARSSVWPRGVRGPGAVRGGAATLQTGAGLRGDHLHPRPPGQEASDPTAPGGSNLPDTCRLRQRCAPKAAASAERGTRARSGKHGSGKHLRGQRPTPDTHAA